MSHHDTGRVAVVDDDASVRRALRRLLGTVGFQTILHDCGTDFLSSPAVHEVDCVLLDVHMPGMSGIEVLEEIRVAASKVPVVLMSARYEADFADKALNAGASSVLRKPFVEEELLAAMADAMELAPAST